MNNTKKSIEDDLHALGIISEDSFWASDMVSKWAYSTKGELGAIMNRCKQVKSKVEKIEKKANSGSFGDEDTKYALWSVLEIIEQSYATIQGMESVLAEILMSDGRSSRVNRLLDKYGRFG